MLVVVIVGAEAVYDKGNGKYIKKAKTYYDKLNKNNSITELENIFISMFGNRFKKNMVESVSNYVIKSFMQQYNCDNTEEFIEDIFPINKLYTNHVVLYSIGNNKHRLRLLHQGNSRWRSQNRGFL